MAQYEKKLINKVDELDGCIEADAGAGRVSQLTDLFLWFNFDVMGEVVLQKSFDMLGTTQWRYIIGLLHSALSLLGPLSPVPWAVQVVFRVFPRVGILKGWFATVACCEEQIRDRVEVSS